MTKKYGAERLETVGAALPDGRWLTLTLSWRDGSIAAFSLRLAGTRPEVPAQLSPEAGQVRQALERLAAGAEAQFPPLPLDWDQLTPFTRDILRTLYERVSCGTTLTYGQLAGLAGHPGKARAVGGAMARNPWPLVVPCHRVLGSGGALTGYTNPHGLDLKALLLHLEGADQRPGKG